MIDPRVIEDLGPPDLSMAELSIWVHQRQFPDASDYWDGNWLVVTAYCISSDSAVRAYGPILHLGEIYGFLKGLESLYQLLKGNAELQCIEPNLHAKLSARTGGHIAIELSITPDNMLESHQFYGEIDQSFLPPVITACKSILERYPLREPEQLSP